MPRKSILEQLPHGSVKVSFGELRRGAPAGVFVNTSGEDTRLVDLPLSEILSQMHPDTFARRSDQASVEIPNDVPDLFGARGERLAPLRVMEKKEGSPATNFTRQNGPTPGPQKAVPPAPIPISLAPATPPKAGPRANSAAAQKPAVPIPFSTPKPPAATASTPRPQFTPAPAPLFRSGPLAAPAPVPSPVIANLPSSAGLFGSASFFIALDNIAENWPDGVRQELAQLKMPDAKVALPPVEICEGLKRGRIQYQWRTIRSWIQPVPIYATPSPYDEEMLELPLRTLTPLFLDFIRANPVNRQAADAENITEFFRKAEQASGTSPELLQPLFGTPADLAPAPAAAPVHFRPAPRVGFTPAPAVPALEQAVEPPASVPAGAASNAAGASVEGGRLCLPLSLINGNWPEPIMRDIAQFNLAGSRVEIPVGVAEAGIKAGRVEFAWRELCTMLNPPSNPAQVSINGETRVALPLHLIAPLFLKSRGTTEGRKRTAVADSIPNLFSQIGKPLPPPPCAEEAVPPPAQAKPPAPVSAPPARKMPTTLSELFGEPDKKSWTPNEIVQRTAQLPNVAGALIALQDGLLVAHQMPQGFKSETIAAFVPQIFGRLNQYSKDLQMGETTAVSFTVDAGTIQVYNAGIIYFAAFGRTASLLPLAELQLIAGELSRHTK